MWWAILLNNRFECEGVNVGLISRALNFVGLVKGQECLCLPAVSWLSACCYAFRTKILSTLAFNFKASKTETMSRLDINSQLSLAPWNSVTFVRSWLTVTSLTTSIVIQLHTAVTADASEGVCSLRCTLRFTRTFCNSTLRPSSTAKKTWRLWFVRAAVAAICGQAFYSLDSVVR